MTADIKYIVKYHPIPVKKVANVFLGFAGLIIGLLYLLWIPLTNLRGPQYGAVLDFIPRMFWDMHFIAFICMAIWLGLRLFRWRRGKIELNEEKITIDGSYYVSISLSNMWEVDIRNVEHHRWCIRLDSKTDAVQIKFKSEKEFESFSEKLVQLVGHVENIKLKTLT
jgi:hypothetical protein